MKKITFKINIFNNPYWTYVQNVVMLRLYTVAEKVIQKKPANIFLCLIWPCARMRGLLQAGLSRTVANVSNRTCCFETLFGFWIRLFIKFRFAERFSAKTNKSILKLIFLSFFEQISMTCIWNKVFYCTLQYQWCLIDKLHPNPRLNSWTKSRQKS